MDLQPVSDPEPPPGPLHPGRWLPQRFLSQATRMLRLPTDTIDLGGLRRTLQHAAAVGLAAGLIGAVFFALVELLQSVLLEELAGYRPLRATGEHISTWAGGGPFRWWLLLLLPAAGGIVCGLLTRYAPEARGGGTDAMIDAFHRHGGVVRRRVLWVKLTASLATLGTGGSGGREGPTMLIGAAVGSTVSRLLKVSPRERRILLVAGAAAGIAAVFRTPLGAALLAVEILYRDGFESDALIPSVLASVVAYSVVISIYGEATLFGHTAHYPFIPRHLPLYGLLALFIAAIAASFVVGIQSVKRLSRRLLPERRWLRPALGGLALGLLFVPLIVFVGQRIGMPGQGLGMLGGGYGAAQMAISGSPLLPEDWSGVEILLLLCAAKLVSASITVGSGGSAGDFAPSLVIGGLFGGAFGRAASLLLEDPSIHAGAFALVGMGAFYGGIAHVPLAALVLVCELAGSYDLLVPLMLAEAVAVVALRNRTLYPAQLRTPRDSAVVRRDVMAGVLEATRVEQVMSPATRITSFEPSTPAAQMLDVVRRSLRQGVFPVRGPDDRWLGLVNGDVVLSLDTEGKQRTWGVAADVMQALVSVSPSDSVARAIQVMRAAELAEVPIIDSTGAIIGFLHESDLLKLHLDTARSDVFEPVGDLRDETTEIPITDRPR